MPKHETKILALTDIVAYLQSDDAWYDVVGIEIEGLREALELGETDNFESASNIESEYLREHRSDKYEITWPEHVTYPRLNSDASYRLIE